MEIKGIIRELIGDELVIESAEGEMFRLPQRFIPGAALEQTIYISCSDEPTKPAREALNELLGSNET